MGMVLLSIAQPHLNKTLKSFVTKPFESIHWARKSSTWVWAQLNSMVKIRVSAIPCIAMPGSGERRDVKNPEHNGGGCPGVASGYFHYQKLVLLL